MVDGHIRPYHFIIYDLVNSFLNNMHMHMHARVRLKSRYVRRPVNESRVCRNILNEVQLDPPPAPESFTPAEFPGVLEHLLRCCYKICQRQSVYKQLSKVATIFQPYYLTVLTSASPCSVRP
jgi:hypothetical protein